MPPEEKKKANPSKFSTEFTSVEETEEDKVAWKGLISKFGNNPVLDTRRVVKEEMHLGPDDLQVEVGRRLEEKKEGEEDKKTKEKEAARIAEEDKRQREVMEAEKKLLEEKRKRDAGEPNST